MGLKWWRKTRWNNDKRHKDGFNTDRARDVTYSSKRETKGFEIKTRDSRTPPPPQENPLYLLLEERFSVELFKNFFAEELGIDSQHQIAKSLSAVKLSS